MPLLLVSSANYVMVFMLRSLSLPPKKSWAFHLNGMCMRLPLVSSANYVMEFMLRSLAGIIQMSQSKANKQALLKILFQVHRSPDLSSNSIHFSLSKTRTVTYAFPYVNSNASVCESLKPFNPFKASVACGSSSNSMKARP